MENYRQRIYEKYSSIFNNTPSSFDTNAAVRWGGSYDYYFRGWLPQDKSVAILDLACGDGKLLYFFIKRGYSNVKGIDISHEQVSIAQQVSPNVYEGDICTFLHSHPNEFDLITGIDIIEHLQKNEVITFLDSCYSCLKTKGRLILQTPNSDSPMSNSVHHGDFTHEVQFTASSLSKLLRLSGFDTIEAREQGPIARSYSVKSSIRYAAWQVIRILLKFWNLVEVGGSGSGVFTRVFLISASKP